MPLQIRHISEKEAPKPNARGGTNEDVHQPEIGDDEARFGSCP